MWGVGTHGIFENGTVSPHFSWLPTTDGIIHHYRHLSQDEVQLGQLAETEDRTLGSEVVKVETALAKIFGPGWHELLSRWGEVDGTRTWTCGRNDSHGPPSWKRGIMQLQ